MATALWIVLGALALALVVWRLRRAQGTLSSILREERERTDAERAAGSFGEDDHEAADEPEPHQVGRHRRPH